MSCKYNNCNICGYKSECEIYKENAELKEKVKEIVTALLNIIVTEVTLNPLYLNLTQEAEQFLKKVSE